MRVFFFSILFVLSFLRGTGQSKQPFDSISAPPEFQLRDDVVAVFDSFSNIYRLNFADGDRFYRRIYDTNFNLKDEYIHSPSSLLLSPFPEIGKANFSLPLVTSKGYYEVYSIERGLDIYKIDFIKKKDSLVAHFEFDHLARSGERISSLIPGEDGLKILTYSKSQNAFNVYDWKPGDSTRKFVFELPEKSMSKAEEKIHDKVTQIKLTKLWKDSFVPVKINSEQALPAGNQIYYTENRIYILLPIPYNMGIYIIDIDLKHNTLQTRNYFLNDLRVNSGDDQYAKMKPVAMVFDSTLVIQNSSYHKFEFHFYDLFSPALLKKYSVHVSDSFQYLVHSSLMQQGTFTFKNQEKEIERGKTFMRKVEGDFSFITMPLITKDSVIFTISRLKQTKGIEGALINAAIFALSTPLQGAWYNWITFGTFSGSRDMFLYAHAKFSRREFVPSTAKGLETTIDRVLDQFEKRALKSSSSFFIQKNQESIIGALEPRQGIFELFRFSND